MLSPYQEQIFPAEENDNDTELTRSQILFLQMHAKGNNWPKAIGIVEIVLGFVLLILGASEIIILIMSENKIDNNLVVLEKENCYGAGFFAGIVMVIAGSTAVRASLSQRNTITTRFFNCMLLFMVLYGALTILLIVAYCVGWTSSDKYPNSSRMKDIHYFVTAFSILGLIFAVIGFLQYIKVICFGDIALCSSWLACCCPCIYYKRRYKELVPDSSH